MDNSEAMNNSQIWKYAFFIVVIAALGLNIFVYLAKGTDLLAEILKLFTQETTEISKKVVKTSAKGAKAGVDVAERVLTTGIEKIEDVIEDAPGELEKGIERGVQDLEQVLRIPKISSMNLPHPDRAMSSAIQRRGRSGYCFIGNDRGFRSCIEVGPNDTCMSNQIFPTRDICIHPNLRR